MQGLSEMPAKERAAQQSEARPAAEASAQAEPKTTEDIPRSVTHSFGYALHGIAHSAATERNLKIHIVAAVLALVACAVLRCTSSEWAIVIVMVALVISAELFNTAIEAVVDLASYQLHPLAKKAKDCAAGAVLVLAMAAVVVGLIVYIGAWMRL